MGLGQGWPGEAELGTALLRFVEDADESELFRVLTALTLVRGWPGKSKEAAPALLRLL